jgi:hypothetical protein
MNLIRTLTNANASAWIFIALLGTLYALVPFGVSWVLPNPYFELLAKLCAVCIVSIGIGFSLPLLDHRFEPGRARITIDATAFHVTVWLAFALFLLITFSTAKSIPVISVFHGADADELSQQRGDFLKGRTGAESALLYLSTLFVSALLPYSLVNLFIEKSRYRFALVFMFFVFSISFLQKALFVNVVFPLLYLAAQRYDGKSKSAVWLVLASPVILYALTVLASGGQSEFEAAAVTAGASFFGSTYVPDDAIDLLIWRSIGVPVFTATDTLLVFNEQFGNQPLWGATSSFFAAIFGLERVPLEKLVFEQQFGWNDIANANAVFFTDGYVNLGWPGVALFSLFVGQSLRWFSRSRDEAFRSLWVIYCFALFSGPLIGMLLSNGYILMFAFALFARLKSHRKGPPSNPATA